MGFSKNKRKNRTKKKGGKPMTKEDIKRAQERMIELDQQDKEAKKRNAQQRAQQKNSAWRAAYNERQQKIKASQAYIEELDSIPPPQLASLVQHPPSLVVPSNSGVRSIFGTSPPEYKMGRAREAFSRLSPEKQEQIRQDEQKHRKEQERFNNLRKTKKRKQKKLEESETIPEVIIKMDKCDITLSNILANEPVYNTIYREFTDLGLMVDATGLQLQAIIGGEPINNDDTWADVGAGDGTIISVVRTDITELPTLADTTWEQPEELMGRERLLEIGQTGWKPEDYETPLALPAP